jgi:hypothetical protein
MGSIAYMDVHKATIAVAALLMFQSWWSEHAAPPAA